MSGIGPLPGLSAEQRDFLELLLVWSRGTIIPNWDPTIWRWDCDGRVIRFGDYGLRSEYGWEKDHTIPLGIGGPDHISNLRPRHWFGNASAGGIVGALAAGAGLSRR
jgi:hypothetical protein